MSSPYSSTQLTVCAIIDEYAKNCTATAVAITGSDPSRFVSALQKIVEWDRPSHYSDLVSHIQRIRSQCQQLINLFRDHGKVPHGKLPLLAVIVQGDRGAGPTAFSVATAERCVGDDFEKLKKAMSPGQRLIASQQLTEAREAAVAAIEEAKIAKGARDLRVRAAAACALVALKVLPKKPSPLIKGIMDSVKKEENQELQGRSSATIARLVQLFTDMGRRGPAEKVVANLVKFSCVEVAETPEFPVHAAKTNCILSMSKEEDRVDHPEAAKWAREAKEARITRRGAKEALEILSKMYGAELLDTIPSLKGFMQDPLVAAPLVKKLSTPCLSSEP